jgi:hypothetical protein
VALADIRALAVELGDAIGGGVAPRSGWNDRIADTRLHWQLYGDAGRFPGLGTAESEAAAVLQDLASLQFEAAHGLARADARARLVGLLERLDRAEETLPDVF